MTVRTLPRACRALVAFAVLPLAVAGAVAGGVATAPPAAAGRVHVSGTTFTKGSQQVVVSVRLRLLEYGSLRLTAPGSETSVEVASGHGPKTLRYALDLDCPTYAGSCRDGGRKVPAENGVWRVEFTSSKLLSGERQSASFTVAVPPAQPTGLAARTARSGQIRVRWHEGAEPDLTAYRVIVDGRTHRVSVADACEAARCSASVDAPAGGQTATVRLEAVRDGGSADTTLASTASSTTVRLPARSGTSGHHARRTGAGEPGSAREHGGAFPTPTLGGNGPGGVGTAAARLPEGPLGARGPADPYPTFGRRPTVAPFTPVGDTSAQRGTRVEPLTRGAPAPAVPVALGLACAMVVAHLWLWSRFRGRLLPVRRRPKRAAA